MRRKHISFASLRPTISPSTSAASCTQLVESEPIGAALKLRRSCDGASPEASVLRWSSVRAAMELRRSRRRCLGAPPELQWSFAGAVGAALELRRSCNGVSPEPSALRWSSIRAAMEVGRSCNGVSPEHRCFGGAAMELARRPRRFVGTLPGLRWHRVDRVEAVALAAVIQRSPAR
ncbi:hypothetical protein TRIUR3_27672 [Triticum urartu]|uniref:Uncharacterized protein n=1 Tax=Triticum urartu TaxID=4572 RepID=M7YV49_TRIUA|nr:hypothetical protein TRIUR3_27672 [Triticum urartu]